MNAREFGVLVGIVGMLVGVEPSEALVLSVNPPTQTVIMGGALSVDVDVSGLTADGVTLGGFDLDVIFDSTILQPTGVTFGSLLNGGDVSNSLQFFDLAVPGDVNASEVSLLTAVELGLLQGDSFTLFSLSFTGIGVGTSSLTLVVNSLVDGEANTVAAAQVLGAEAVIESARVPEPATLALFGLGLAGLGFMRRRLS